MTTATVESAVAPKPIKVHDGQFGETVYLATLAIARIEMPTFQRERLLVHIDKIASEWDATAYAFPCVALFEGRLICIDGQQRLAALQKQGEHHATVHVVVGIASEERLAELFLRINRDRKLLNAFRKFVAALHANDAGALEIDTILRKFGKEAATKATASGKVPAGSIARIYDLGGGELLSRVLMIIENAWGNLDVREAYEGKTLVGLATFLRRYWEKINDQRLVGLLRGHYPGYILQAVEKRQANPMTYSDYLREQYNKGLRGKSKL